MPGLSILLVEDEAIVRTMVKTTLERAGHTVSAVTDDRAGLQRIAEENFDVVITDLLLGQSHGIVILHSAKAKTPAPRVVAISGGSVLAAGALGADATLKKPFTREELLAAVTGKGR